MDRQRLECPEVLGATRWSREISWAAGGVVAAGILTKTVRRYIQHGRQAWEKKRVGARTSPPKSRNW